MLKYPACLFLFKPRFNLPAISRRRLLRSSKTLPLSQKDGGAKMQALKGVTGSGKTFTMANVIAHFNRPPLLPFLHR
jgi:Tfp pilus assembly ATPase PilU